MIFIMKSLVYRYEGAITNHGLFINRVEQIVGVFFFFPLVHRSVDTRCWRYVFFSAFLASFSISLSLYLSLGRSVARSLSNFGTLFCILSFHHTPLDISFCRTTCAEHIKCALKAYEKCLIWLWIVCNVCVCAYALFTHIACDYTFDCIYHVWHICSTFCMRMNEQVDVTAVP